MDVHCDLAGYPVAWLRTLIVSGKHFPGDVSIYEPVAAHNWLPALDKSGHCLANATAAWELRRSCVNAARARRQPPGRKRAIDTVIEMLLRAPSWLKHKNADNFLHSRCLYQQTTKPLASGHCLSALSNNWNHRSFSST